jgi:hypothetical protein
MSYPLLDVFWSMFEFFLWLLWIWVLVMVILDIFRSHDLSGWAKALWLLFVVVIPLIGVLVYVIARGDGMHERMGQRQATREAEAYRGDVGAGAPASHADQLAQLADLRDRGVITAEEFSREKERVLA